MAAAIAGQLDSGFKHSYYQRGRQHYDWPDRHRPSDQRRYRGAFTANGPVYGNGTGALQATAAGTTGR